MNNGTSVSFSSKNQGVWNGRKEYLVYHHTKEGCDIIGVAFYTGTAWQLLHYRYAKLAELRGVIRHKYTGSKLKDN